jgi:protein-S-isoprenylcysteine O-methyltransferase Ste14
MKLLRGLGYFISTMIIYLGPVLLGWGFDDLPGFFAVQPRQGYVLVTLTLAVAVGYQAIDAPEGIRGRGGQKEKRVARQSLVRLMVISLLFAALVLLPLADRREIGVMGENLVARWVGLTLYGLGIGLVFWSGMALGRLYSGEVTIQENHHLVTSGPYRHIRHPRYLGALALGFGLSLLFRSWISLIVAVAFIGLILLRIGDEEALMHQEFGREWEAYCECSWRLLPYVY